MARARCLTRAGRTIASLVAALLLVGCESQPPASEREPHSRPTTDDRRGASTAPVTPQRPATEEQDAAARPETAQPDPDLPNYLAIVSRVDPRQVAQIEVLSAAGHRLALDTRNVGRLRIDRQRLPLRRDRSIALILDGQGFEWRADSKVIEFERSINGVWTPVKPD